jgi:hypothetical protein
MGWASKNVTWSTYGMKDFDQSGGNDSRPGLDLAMKRCREGVSDGIVVGKNRQVRSVPRSGPLS